MQELQMDQYRSWKRSGHPITVIGLLFAASCMSDAPTSIATSTKLGPMAPAFTIENAGTQTLGVNMYGNNKFDPAGNYPLTAAVTGGTGPYDYYWYYRIC